MSNFDTITDTEGKEYLVFDSSELYDDSQIGEKSDDFEILRSLGKGAFGQVFKVRSKINNKVYAMKKLNIKEIRDDNEKAYELTMNETAILERLSHPHIIKYYKKFTEGNFLYIIIEFATNGDIEGFIEAHKKFNKHISEEVLWNIFLQCMGALAYVHEKGVIHRDIKPANLLMDNNMVVKLGDFGVSNLTKKYTNTCVGTPSHMPLEIMEENYDQKVDVYSMGVSFFEMCYFHIPKKIVRRLNNNGEVVCKYEKIVKPEDKNVYYSKELLNIIEIMLEEDKYKRKTSQEILTMIENEFSKKYVTNTSIDSIVRCLYSFIPLTKQFLKIQINYARNKPITNAYIQCLRSVSNPSLLDWNNSIKYFRQTLCSENPKLEGTKEIEPRFVFAFLIKELHKELNNPHNMNNTNKHLIISGEEASKTSVVSVMFKFVTDLYNKFNSIISNSFLGLMKVTNICSQCKIETYSFNSFFFVTFNLEQILKSNNFTQLNIQEQFLKQKNISQKSMYCGKCVNKTIHNSYKNYYSLPNLLIISIQRGITYNYKTPIIIAPSLDLTQSVEFQYSKKQFNLVSLLGRKVKNGNEIFFSIISIGNQWFYSEGNMIKEVSFPSNYNDFGDILMLFYI